MTNYTIKVPESLSTAFVNVNNLNRQFNKYYKLLTKDDTLVFDFRSTGFIGGEMTSLLGMFFEQASLKTPHVAYRGDFQPKVKALLDKNGFLKHYANHEIKEDTYNTTIKFYTHKNVTEQDIRNYLESHLFPAIEDKISKDFKDEISTCIYEVYHNVLDHSGQTRVFMCGQFYPKYNILSISISDIGYGLPNRIRESVGIANFEKDTDAIEWAFKEGNTTKDVENGEVGGIGLHTIKSFLGKRGNIHLYSNNGYYNIPQSGIIKVKDLNHKLRGTLLVLEFDVNACSKSFKTDKIGIDEDLPF